MSRTTFNWLLLALLSLVAAADWTISWNAATPNAEFLPEMARSVPYDSFSANRAFADAMPESEFIGWTKNRASDRKLPKIA